MDEEIAHFRTGVHAPKKAQLSEGRFAVGEPEGRASVRVAPESFVTLTSTTHSKDPQRGYYDTR